jgi:hypothetical protein
MANHAYAKTGNKLDHKEVDAHIRRIVEEKLKGLFVVDYNEEEKLWSVGYPKDDYMAFLIWISDEVEYENGESKLISEGSVIEFRHGHSFQFMWWVEGVVRENLGKIYNARMFDDGCEIDPKPNHVRYETFEIFCRTKDDLTQMDKKLVKQSKKWWLPSYQAKIIPKEIKEGLNLDFKV